MTYAEFYARIENFPNRFSNRSLASYLSALHALTEARQAGQPCLSLLEQAFTTGCVAKPQNCTEWAAGKRKTDAAISVLFRKLAMRGTTLIPFHYWTAARTAWQI